MSSVAERLYQYAEAVTDPTRGAILVELDRLGEATPTQLARRLEVPPNNLYHHIRILLRLGVVDQPRVVAGSSYVEKYYRINPELRAALRLDPRWYSQLGKAVTPEDRQATLVSVCLTMALLLQAAARDLRRRDPGELDRTVQEHELISLSINRLSRQNLEYRVDALHEMCEVEDRRFAEDTSPRTDLMLVATLPDMWSADVPDSEE
jgi:DNA-binding transcriptional ArsR family regulator